MTIKLRSGVKFADGTTMDAAAVKTSLDRDLTLATSARKSELSSVSERLGLRSVHSESSRSTRRSRRWWRSSPTGPA